MLLQLLLAFLQTTAIQSESVCADGEVRLVNGRDALEGRVEVCVGGMWGSVCDNQWTSLNSLVVCRQLGIDANKTLIGKFGDGPIVLSNVQCQGNESSLTDCLYDNSSSSSRRNNGSLTVPCSESEAIGVVCIPADATPECRVSDVRLVDEDGAPTTGSGRVEYCIDGGRWASVCDDGWGKLAASVACRETGALIGPPSYLGTGGFRATGPIVEQVVDCTGMENELQECFTPNKRILDSGCTAQEFAGIICGTQNECDGGSMRLVGPNPHEGRVEVCHLSVWGTVCSDAWSLSNSQVACRNLGFSEEDAQYLTWEDGEPGTGPIILDNVACSGFERSLFFCGHDVLNQHDCTHQQDISIRCLRGNITLPTNSTDGTEDTNRDRKFRILGEALSTFLIVVIIIIAIIAVIVCIKRRRSRRKMFTFISDMEGALASEHSTERTRTMSNNYRRADDVMRNSVDTLNTRVVRCSFIRRLTEDCLIPVGNITLLEQIGEGEFGKVFKATLADGSQPGEKTMVAVKTLKDKFSQEIIDEIMEESLKLKGFQHKNIMGLLGVCAESRPAPYIVMPFMENGSLLAYLRREKTTLFLPKGTSGEKVHSVGQKLTDVCHQVASGMKYLARERFVHRDLAARNCMIDENFVIKIADFGLSEDIYLKNYFRQVSNAVKLPVKWMAPESLHEGVFSVKSDVWSFGVTCWEVFSCGKVPYGAMDPGSVLELIDRGERLKRPANAAYPEEMHSLIRSCWDEEPAKRPTFDEIEANIDMCMSQLTGYMKLVIPSPATDQQHLSTQHPKAKTRGHSYGTDDDDGDGGDDDGAGGSDESVQD